MPAESVEGIVVRPIKPGWDYREVGNRSVTILSPREAPGRGELNDHAIFIRHEGENANGKRYFLLEEYGSGLDYNDALVECELMDLSDPSIESVEVIRAKESNSGACSDPECCGPNYIRYEVSLEESYDTDCLNCW